MKSLILLGSIGVLFLSACTGGDRKSSITDAAAVEEQTGLVTPRVFFENIKDGDVLTSPVIVQMGVEGMLIEPAGKVREGYGHHHLLVNQSSWPKGEVIPESDSTIHYGLGQTSDTVALASGEYVLALQFADGVHASYGEEMASTVRVTVQ